MQPVKMKVSFSGGHSRGRGGGAFSVRRPTQRGSNLPNDDEDTYPDEIVPIISCCILLLFILMIILLLLISNVYVTDYEDETDASRVTYRPGVPTKATKTTTGGPSHSTKHHPGGGNTTSYPTGHTTSGSTHVPGGSRTSSIGPRPGPVPGGRMTPGDMFCNFSS
ncbi:uncharacterized protein LOC142799722 isoform X2 [Rhipicephalus microplus]|uniref:uncharacterized protein LOC142799722 isoform X2 n=1 Tax=Rhipicephalus microplus TaxID=6941 RepID=UPI003F6D5AAD